VGRIRIRPPEDGGETWARRLAIGKGVYSENTHPYGKTLLLNPNLKPGLNVGLTLTSGYSAKYSLAATACCYNDSDYPQSCWPDTLLCFYQDSPYHMKYGYVNFNYPNISSSNIQSAYLKLYRKLPTSGTYQVGMTAITSYWSECTIPWNYQPSVYYVTHGDYCYYGWNTYGVTDYVKYQYDNNCKYGFRLTTYPYTGYQLVFASEVEAEHPILEINCVW